MLLTHLLQAMREGKSFKGESLRRGADKGRCCGFRTEEGDVEEEGDSDEESAMEGGNVKPRAPVPESSWMEELKDELSSAGEWDPGDGQPHRKLQWF